MTDGTRTSSQHPMASHWHGVIRRRRRRVPMLATLLLIFLSSGSVCSEIEKIEDKESSSSYRPTAAVATGTEIRAATTSRAPGTSAPNDVNDGRMTGITERTLREATTYNYSTSSKSPQPIVEEASEETSALENTIGRREKESPAAVTQSTFRIVDNTTDKLEESTVSSTGISIENKATSAVDEYHLKEDLSTKVYLENEVSSTSSAETEPKTTKINGDESSPSSQAPTTLMTLIQSTRSVSITSSPNLTVVPVSTTTPSTVSQSPSSLSSSPPVTSTYEAALSSTIEYEFIGLKENTIPPEYSARNGGENGTSSSTISRSSLEQSTTEREASVLTTMQATTEITMTEQPTVGLTTTEQPATDSTTTEQPAAAGPTTMEEPSGSTMLEETTGVTTTEEITEETIMETSDKIMDENTESMRETMTEETTTNGEFGTETPTAKMLDETTNETEITTTETTTEERSNETTEGTTYWTTDNATTEGNTEQLPTEVTTEPITEEITTEWERIDYTPEETTARIVNTTDRNVYINIPISRGTINPGELTPLVKIIFEGTWMEVCPHLPGLRQSLADLLALAVKKNVHVGQIVYQNNPCGNGTDTPMPSSSTAQQLITTESSVTSLLLYVVDKEGNLDVEMTKMLPRVFRESSAKLRVTIHSFQLVQEADSGNAIAVIIVSCVALLCLVLLTGLLLVVTSRRTRFNYGERCRPVSLDAYSLDSVSAYNSVRGRKAVGSSSGGVAATTVSTAATLRASKRSYGNPSFDDSMTTPSHPLSFAGLSSFANEREKIAEEFAAIPRVTASIDELPQGAEVKNRYANVVPLPETRVPLTRIDNDPLTEYINASYVRGPKNATKYYIACQAPLESTVADFWRMIWEQRCKVVIMLTDLVENGVEKCAEYVPPSEVTDCHRIFGDFRVTLKKRETKEKYAISTILLKNLESDTFREIWHIWYMWPANGVQSSDAAGLIAVLLEARAFQRGGPAPVLVHCSPGTGRTGTLIALDLAIRQYEITRTVDVPRVVYTIRRDRAGAVRTNEQYAFIYKALNLYATRLAGGACDS